MVCHEKYDFVFDTLKRMLRCQIIKICTFVTVIITLHDKQINANHILCSRPNTFLASNADGLWRHSRRLFTTACWYKVTYRGACPSKMPACCVVYGFSNTPTDQITIHRFPSDPHYSRLWINFIKSTRIWEIPISRFEGICSVHFEDSCFVNKLQVSMSFAKCL